jgi:hypothetical protein
MIISLTITRFGFGRKEEPQSFTTDITDKEDLEEIKEISDMLNPNEEVFVVARHLGNITQS